VRNLINPREIATLGTGPLPRGGGGNCGRYPAAAMVAMGPGDRLISVQVRPAVHDSAWPKEVRLPRPEPMGIADGPLPRGPKPRVSHRVFTQELNREHGNLWIFVAYATRPTRTEIEEAERILDSISLG
jgi:hypothetical protein